MLTYMNYTLKFYKKGFVDICGIELKNIDINSWIPLLFSALDGVGDHRALYHVPNNYYIYLDMTQLPKKARFDSRIRQYILT